MMLHWTCHSTWGVAQVSNGDDGWTDVLFEECDRNNALPSTGDHVETDVEVREKSLFVGV